MLALLAIPILLLLFISIIAVIVLVFMAFWIWMLIDCIVRKDWQGSEQVAWILVIVLVNWLGALIYLLAVKIPKDGKKKKKHKGGY